MTLDMTRGKPMALLLRFAIPMMLSSLLQQMYTLCDSFIIGRLLGTDAFTATATAANVNWFPLHITMGATTGFGVALAQFFGARKQEDFHRHFAHAIVLSFALGLLFSLAGLTFAEPFLHLLNTPLELLDYVLRYLRVLWIGFSVTAILNMFTTALLSMGDSRTPLVALAISSIINIVLDITLIAWLDLSLEGAALATVIAQAAAAFWSFRGLRRLENALPRKEHFRFRRDVVKRLLYLSTPRMLSNGVTTSGELLVQAVVNSWGVAFLTGLTASRRYMNLLNVVNSGLEGAVATYVGQNWGAEEKDRIRQGVRSAITMGLVTSLTIGGIVIVFAESMIRFFVPDGTAEAVTFGIEALRVMAFFLPSLYLLCEYRAAIQGMGNSVIPMYSGFLELAMRIACTLLLPLLIGQKALYFTDAAAWVSTAAMLMICYYSLRRKHLSK